MATKFDARQTISRDQLQQIYPNLTDIELDNLLRSIDFDLTQPCRLDADDPISLVVNVGPSLVSNTESDRQKSMSHIGSLVPDFTSGTITFPSTNGGNIVSSPGNTVALTIPSNTYVKVLVSLDNTNSILVTPGSSSGTEAGAIVPAPVINSTPIGYVTVFNNAGTISNIAQNKIYQFTGSGGSSATTTSSVTYTGTAGENLSDGDAVYICRTTSDTGRTVGQVYKLDPVTSFRTTYLGIVETGVTSGNPVTVQVAGEVDGFTGLTQGGPVYASVTTPGSFQLTSPSSNAIILGWGSTVTTKMIINGALGFQNVLIPNTAGYLFGGTPNGAGTTTTDEIVKLTFATEVFSVLSSVISLSLYAVAAMSSDTKAYSGGGTDAGSVNHNIIDSLDFSTEMSASTGSVITTSRASMAATQSITDGYFVMGFIAPSTAQNTIDKMSFSTETVSNISNSSYSAWSCSSVQNTIYAWTAGGTTTGPGVLSNINKLTFSSDTSAANANSLSVSRNALPCDGASTTLKGYWQGGTTGVTPTNVIEAVTFSNDTVATLAATMVTARSSQGGMDSTAKGYTAGGYEVGSVVSDKNEFLLFSGETTGTASTVLATPNTQITGTQN